MLQDFPNAVSLPGGRKTGPPSDSSTYYNLWKVARNVVERCVRNGQVGWQQTGMDWSQTPHLPPAPPEVLHP